VAVEAGENGGRPCVKITQSKKKDPPHHSLSLAITRGGSAPATQDLEQGQKEIRKKESLYKKASQGRPGQRATESQGLIEAPRNHQGGNHEKAPTKTKTRVETIAGDDERGVPKSPWGEPTSPKPAVGTRRDKTAKKKKDGSNSGQRPPEKPGTEEEKIQQRIKPRVKPAKKKPRNTKP